MRASGSVNGSLKITKRRPVFKNSVSGVCDRDATVPGDAGRIYGSKFRVHLPSHMDVKNENLLENDPMWSSHQSPDFGSVWAPWH